jgi:N,N-dimethylformamidase
VELLGYAQPCIAHPGQTVEVKVSTTQPGFTAEVIRLGLTEEPIASYGSFPGRHQELIGGSYLTAKIQPAPLAGHSVQFWFFPTLLNGPQCLLAGFASSGGWEVAIGADRRVNVARLSGAGDVLTAVSAGPVLQARRWYFAAVSWDAAGLVTLTVTARDSRAAPSQEGPYDLGGSCPPASLVTVGAAVPGGRPLRCFNGKIDTPQLFTGSGELRHEWRFGPGAALPPHLVPDHGPARCDGVLVNMPTLGVTGRNWTPGTESFRTAPQEYQAAHFHSDDLSDAGWATDLSFEVPAGWPSGVYGIRLRAGEHEDVVPLIVSATTGTQDVAVLLPTFSYLAYANEHASWERPIKASAGGAGSLTVTERDRFTAEHRLLSLYELHADGSGTCLSSWRRPVLNMRPGYHLPLVRGPHQFSADLELLYWLESRGASFDVITDDDLHRRGAAALERYRVVLTGSHPEYVSRQLLDGLDSYLASGGRLMYLGGNGFYWVTTAPGDDPFVIEVRRGMAGTRVWESPPGEWHQAMTGEHGGLWRHRGRPPQALAGVGFTAQGFDRSLPYEINPYTERSAFIVEGIDTEALLGQTGSVLGGPAGFEIDRADPALGTPDHAVVVASARRFSGAYQGAVEDVTTADSQQGGDVSDLVRSDVVFFETGAGGAVFSVGSIAWCGALRDGDSETPVGRMTWNVLSRFREEEPFGTDV